MYDLPSENPEEPGLPDEFHDLQPQLLSRTLHLVDYAADCIFTGSDLNLYYDVRHPLWYKRTDWFLAVDVPRLYDGTDLRSSYVVWQEGVVPFVVVELLSPGTAQEDLGDYADPQSEDSTAEITADSTDVMRGRSVPAPENLIANGTLRSKPPRKWDVYERILRVPYYVVFNHRNGQIRFFQLVGAHYQEQALNPTNPKVWIPELKAGLGLWQGVFAGVSRLWLRWCDQQGHWMPTDTEVEQQRAEAEQQRAEAEQQRAEQAEAQLRQTVKHLLQLGMSVAQVAQITGLAVERVDEWSDPVDFEK
jgi:Uma2 family endonuclease